MPAKKSPKPKRAAKVAPKARKAPAKMTKVKLLSGGNPQIPLGYGDQPVQDYINAMPEWKQDIGRWLDRVISRTLPEVQKAVKWNTPFYGIEGQGWFLGFHCLTKYVKVAFFKGAHLEPKPPGTSKQKDVRYLDIHENEAIDEKQFVEWVKQAAVLPGEKM